MTKCDWCGADTNKTYKVMSLGDTFNVCNKCKDANDNEICIKCGGPIIGQGSIKGLCYGCAQEQYEEQQRKAEELANGVAVELLEAYSNGVEFTEDDYNQWVTFGQGNFTPQYLKQCRHNWIRRKLIENGGWSPKVVEDNLDTIETLMERHLSKVLNGRYMIINYDSKNSKQRIREFVDHIGVIFIVEKK